LADYADVRVARSGGMRSFDPELFQVGKDRFDVVRATNADLVDALRRDAQQVREAAERAGSALVVGIVLVALVLAVVGASAARRLRQRVVDPLASMESVAHLLATDPDADPPALLPGGAADGARVVRAVAAALDELAAAQQRARAAADALAAEQRALDQARQDFVSNVSHELRTPLTTIAGYLEVAEEELEGHLDPLQQRMLDATVRNVDRLQALIDDILTLSRVEAAATDVETVPLRQLVTDVVDDLRTGASRRGIVLGAVVPDDDELLVLADRAQLSRAILNLASNAVKFSRDDGVVELAARRDGDHLVVVVRDEGIGVPAADLPSLGTRFFRAGNAVAGAVPGTGLGLRIVQAIVGQHGGTLQFESVEGKGTTVTVRLPAHVAA
jgi:signal transduction histidine kinase